MSDRLKANRRTVLSMAALGLVGSGTAIAKRTANSTSSSKSVLAEYADFELSFDDTGWALLQQDSGMTRYNQNPNPPTGAVTSRWEFDLSDDGIDLPLVSDGTVYAITNIHDATSEPYKQTLYALDAATGTERWNVEVEAGGIQKNFGSNNLAVADGRVYLSWNEDWGKGTRAFDAATGDEVWSIENGNSWLVLTHDGLVFEDAVGGRGLTSVSRKDGGVQWTQDFGSRFDGLVVATDDSVYVSVKSDDGQAGTLYSLSAATGETEWGREFEDVGVVELLATESDLFYDAFDELLSLDPETGETVWSWTYTPQGEPENKYIDVRSVGDGRVHLHVESTQHHALDAETGDELWTKDLGERQQELVVSGDVVYYTEAPAPDPDSTYDPSPDSIVACDAETGERISKHTFENTLPEELIPVGNTIYMTAAGVDLVALTAAKSGDGSGDSSSDDSDEGGSDDSDDGC
ncbi:hypothetical protein A4G99_03525 [Haladaptatus sp. R4]|uniref:outer membrane protein assembly factor BamB family protein n=1 Tax=Haladaptatus sp. R4 TaxID=1679489 RepID=UPI0007B4E893|nr:PQQ-binding-like beta-propeller repeat protein [Haladaptatus sp. R4]KZN25553.1 hypothetical protein A4G99_03525 [Haladaptatus sp. R4]